MPVDEEVSRKSKNSIYILHGKDDELIEMTYPPELDWWPVSGDFYEELLDLEDDLVIKLYTR